MSQDQLTRDEQVELDRLKRKYLKRNGDPRADATAEGLARLDDLEAREPYSEPDDVAEDDAAEVTPETAEEALVATPATADPAPAPGPAKALDPSKPAPPGYRWETLNVRGRRIVQLVKR